MAEMEEREFTLWLEVRLKGYGSRAQEDQLAERVGFILSTRLHTDVDVSVVRDSDRSSDDVLERALPDSDRCELCRRGEPEWQSGEVIYRCVKCGSEMNVPEQPSGGTLGRRMRRAGWKPGGHMERGSERGSSEGSPALGCLVCVLMVLAGIGAAEVVGWLGWRWPF